MNDLLQPWITLAQNGAAPPTEGATQSPGNPAAPAGPGGPASPPARGFDGLIWIIMLVMVLMIVFSMFGGRKQRKQREAMLAAIKKHDTVQTVGGVIGSVVEVKPNTVVLKVDENSNTRITFSRSAIQQVLDASPDAASTST